MPTWRTKDNFCHVIVWKTLLFVRERSFYVDFIKVSRIYFIILKNCYFSWVLTNIKMPFLLISLMDTLIYLVAKESEMLRWKEKNETEKEFLLYLHSSCKWNVKQTTLCIKIHSLREVCQPLTNITRKNCWELNLVNNFLFLFF